MARECVEHIKASNSPWSTRTFFIQIRGLITTGTIIGTLLIGKPWIFEYIENKETNITEFTKTYAQILTATTIFLLFYIWKTLRKGYLTQYKLARMKHELEHTARDYQSDLLRSLINNPSSHPNVSNIFPSLLTQSCEIIASYFQHLTHEEDIAASIRLAVAKETNITDTTGPSFEYKTVARSKGLDPNRKRNSEPIQANEGLPLFMRNKRKMGVLFYNDLIEAAKLGAYKLTKNDEDYPNDIQTMMVAPINAWSGQDHDMIGILFISSKHTGTFKTAHTDEMLYVTDHLAQTIASFTEFVKLHGEIENHVSTINQLQQETHHLRIQLDKALHFNQDENREYPTHLSQGGQHV